MYVTLPCHKKTISTKTTCDIYLLRPVGSAARNHMYVSSKNDFLIIRRGSRFITNFFQQNKSLLPTGPQRQRRSHRLIYSSETTVGITLARLCVVIYMFASNKSISVPWVSDVYLVVDSHGTLITSCKLPQMAEPLRRFFLSIGRPTNTRPFRDSRDATENVRWPIHTDYRIFCQTEKQRAVI